MVMFAIFCGRFGVVAFGRYHGRYHGFCVHCYVLDGRRRCCKALFGAAAYVCPGLGHHAYEYSVFPFDGQSHERGRHQSFAFWLRACVLGALIGRALQCGNCRLYCDGCNVGFGSCVRCRHRHDCHCRDDALGLRQSV